MTQYLTYGFRIVGSTREDRRLVVAADAFQAYSESNVLAEVDREAYLSAFSFGDDFRDHLDETGSTAGFNGDCWSPWIWFDIDAEYDLEHARRSTARLAYQIAQQFGISEDAMLIFFSGGKGFHLGLSTAHWAPRPANDFHRITRSFCEKLASEAKVEIDVGVYDKVRAFRAPNSRHPKTGLYKRRLTFDELTRFDVDQIKEMAASAAPFDLPERFEYSEAASHAWTVATEDVNLQQQARMARRVANDGTAALNRLTVEFIRDGAPAGDRHRRLFSAAANLGEFSCPPALAHALLTESALDSGLAPKDVRRQIDCGLKHRTCGQSVDQADSSQLGVEEGQTQRPGEIRAHLADLWTRALRDPNAPSPLIEPGQSGGVEARR